jgi:hypothetical protein
MSIGREKERGRWGEGKCERRMQEILKNLGRNTANKVWEDPGRVERGVYGRAQRGARGSREGGRR